MSDSAKTITETPSIDLRCIDTDDFEVSGNFNSDSASNLMVVFELCDASLRTDCNKDPVAIAKYVEQAYMVILENESLFVHENHPT